MIENEKIKEYKIRIQELSQSIKINYNVSPGDCCEEVNTLLSKLKNIASLSSDLYDQKLKSREFELLVNKIISENKKLKISIYENTNTISINSLKKELEQEKEACENIIIKNENKINSLKNEIKTLIEENDSLTIKYNNVETENSIYKKIIDDIDQGNIDNKNRIVFFENIIETITEKKNRLSVKCKSLKTENGIFKKTIFDLESANVCLTNEYNNFKKENVNFFLYKKIIEELELELLDHKNKIFIFETTIKEMGETNDTLSFKCGNFDVYELNYKKTIAETNSEITKAMKTIENLDKIVKEQTETIYALTSKFNITEEDLYKKNKMIVEFEFDIKKYKIDLESLTKRYQIIFDDMDGLTRKNDELKKECDFYEKWKYDNYQIIDGYRKNISDMDDDIVNYKNKIELLESSLNDFRTANDGLKKECDRLNTCKVDGSISIKEFIMMKETHDISKKKVFELRQEIKKMQFQRGYITKTNT